MGEISSLTAREPRSDALHRILRSLLADRPDVRGAAVLSDDGLILAGEPTAMEARTFATSAALLRFATKAAQELAIGAATQAILRGERDYALTAPAGEGTVLLLVANEDADLGLVSRAARRAAEEIAAAL